MRLYRHYASLPPSARGAVLAIGNFDGLHLGHRAVLELTREKARQQGRPFGLLTFEPHPRQVLGTPEMPFRLTPLRTKVRLLGEMGLDLLYVLPFVPSLYRLTAEDFIDAVLLRGLGAAEVVVGDNFYFGAKRGGSPALLAERGAASGFAVTILPRVAAEGAKLSSTVIRSLLRDGDMAAAAARLGRTWEITGRVLHGAKRGRDLNMPTANIDLSDSLRPAYGVYAVRAALDEGGRAEWRPAVANLGISPMFAYDRPLLEVHLLDFSGDLYGKRLRVALVERLRAEMTFDGLPALMAQMQVDAAQARGILQADV
ncbi:MAG: bifunctional riboflavin kinase/FAD synthetase [Pseudomonadota bacterium]